MSTSSLASAISRNVLLVVCIVLVATVAGTLTGSKDDKKAYRGSLGITVRLDQKATASQVVVGQASDSAQAVATVQSWIGDPTFAAGVLQQAGQNSTTLSIDDLSKHFEVVATTANAAAFQVEVVDGDASLVTRLLEGLTTSLNTKVSQYNAASPNASNLIIMTSGPTIAEEKPSSFLAPLAAFLAGCVIALFLVIALERKRK